MINLPNDWSSLKTTRVMDDLTYEYPDAEPLRSLQMRQEHHYYSFDTKMSLGHLFVLTYQTDGVSGLSHR